MTPLLTRIREKVIASVPEIMELKFGCRVLVHLTEGGGTKGTIVGHDETKQILYVSYAEFHKNQVSVIHELTRHCVILGRPIRLADILLAMPLGTYLKTLGEYARLVVDNIDGTAGPELWDLTQDDLEKQSLECWKFLGEILGV